VGPESLSASTTSREKLRQLLLDAFLLDSSEFRWDLTRADVDTWDSLGTVSLAVGVQDVFGYHLTPAEATEIRSVGDLIALLKSRGFVFDG
jgi:acyl carrier protein